MAILNTFIVINKPSHSQPWELEYLFLVSGYQTIKKKYYGVSHVLVLIKKKNKNKIKWV